MKTKQKIQKVVVGSIIFDKDKILILKRHENEDVFPNLWEIPGGTVEFNEDVESALVRETKEEAGLDVKVIRPISTFDYTREKENFLVHVIQINFLVEKIGGIVRLSSEHDNFAWISKEGINKYNLSEKTKKVINDAFDLIERF